MWVKLLSQKQGDVFMYELVLSYYLFTVLDWCSIEMKRPLTLATEQKAECLAQHYICQSWANIQDVIVLRETTFIYIVLTN